MGASSLFENTSNRPLVIPFMSAAARPCYTPHTHQSSRLTVIVFVAVLFLVGRSVGAELELGPTPSPPSRQRGSCLRVSEEEVAAVVVVMRVVSVRGGLR